MGSKGGGGSTPQYSSQTTSIPDWVQGPAQQAVQTAQTLSQRPYQANPYEQVAPTTSDQLQAYQQIRDMQGGTTGAFNTAMQGYQGLAGGAQLQTPQSITANAQALMNPYTQNVIDPAVAQMRQGLATNLQNIGASANAVNAFGGSRQGVMEGVAQGQEALGEGNLVAQLQNQAYNNAQNTAYNLGSQGLQYGTAALGQIPTLATNQAQEQMREAGLLQTIGQAQQQQNQAGLDTQAGVYQEGMNWPVQNLDILLGALTGAPYGTSTSGYGTVQQASSNTGGQVLGGLASAAGIGASIATII